MDCRTFRSSHLAYLDDTLPGAMSVAAERHVTECDTCAAHDTAVRRGLLLARNLPTIELSGDFASRLAARLEAVRDGECDVPLDGVPLGDWAPSRAELLRAALAAPFGTAFNSTLGRRAAIAAGLLALTYAGSRIAIASGAQNGPNAQDVAIAESMLPMLSPAALTSPALVSSASTGIPVWPAALLADQAPAHMVQPQFMLASW